MITEQLTLNDGNTFIKDSKSVDKLFKQYIEDRKQMYESVLDSELNDDSIAIYKDYFCKYCGELDNDVHPHLWRIIHFLERDYESYIENTIGSASANILLLLTDIDYQDFEKDEYDRIVELEKEWNNFLDLILSVPLLDVNTMEFENKYGVSIYKNKKCDEFVLSAFDEFLETVHKVFPNTLTRLDAIVITTVEYIHLVGDGKYSIDGSTCAYYTDGCLFLASTLNMKEDSDELEEKKFYYIVLFHEFSHFIFSTLSETAQIYWHNIYKDWRTKGINMTRDDDRNSQLYDNDGNESGENVEELWADTNGLILYNMTKFGKNNPTTKEDYIHMPSYLITDTVEYLLRKEYNIKNIF